MQRCWHSDCLGISLAAGGWGTDGVLNGAFLAGRDGSDLRGDSRA